MRNRRTTNAMMYLAGLSHSVVVNGFAIDFSIWKKFGCLCVMACSLKVECLQY